MPAAKSSKTKKLAARPKKATARPANRRPVVASRRAAPKPSPKPAARKAAPARPAKKSMLKAKVKTMKSSARKVVATLKSTVKAKRPVAVKAPARRVAKLNPARQKLTAKSAKASLASPATTPARGAKPGNSGGVVIPIRPQVMAARPAKAPRAPRRPRLKIPHDSVPTAAWFPQPNETRPRPSSFIPAPPRAESPSLVAAPPASSDRLFREDDLEDSQAGIRTVPVRVDMEQGAGKTYVIINPEQITTKAGDGIEWDFRYVGGSDASIDEVSIEFLRPHPFSKGVLKSRKKGSARPHRQVSSIVPLSAVGSQIRYVIHCLNLMKTEIASGRGLISVIA